MSKLHRLLSEQGHFGYLGTLSEGKYLALYTGPGGPISYEYQAKSLDDAVAVSERRKRQWYDDAEDALGLDPDSSDSEIKSALKRGHWKRAYRGRSTSDYDIYSK